MVCGQAFAQQPGQLGDMGFLHPAVTVGALPVAACLIGAALVDLAIGADGDVPRGFRDLGYRGALRFAQFPADGVDELVPGRAARVSRRSITPCWPLRRRWRPAAAGRLATVR